MKTTVRKSFLLVTSLAIFAVSASAEQPAYPVKVSENSRYFVDQKGNPVFWLGYTGPLKE